MFARMRRIYGTAPCTWQWPTEADELQAKREWAARIGAFSRAEIDAGFEVLIADRRAYPRPDIGLLLSATREAAMSGDGNKDQAILANSDAAILAEVAQTLADGGLVIGPSSAHEAARWLVTALFAPRDDAAERAWPVRADTNTWSTPYRDRVLYLTRRLLRFSAEDQRTVLACREEGVFWRGEDAGSLLRVAIAREELTGCESLADVFARVSRT